jgi:acyl-CoA thioester hydrolase
MREIVGMAPTRHYNCWFCRCRRSFVTASRHLVHVSRQSIRWGDMDAFGHVNNTVYFRYMEQARIEWLVARAPQYTTIDSDEGSVIVNASCDFLLPLVYPGELEVRMFVGKPGRSSIDSYYEIWSDGRKFADGASRIVWIRRSTGRSTPLPGAIKALLHAENG